MEYIVHLNYGPAKKVWDYQRDCYQLHGTHMVRCPNGQGKILVGPELARFLNGKKWRLAK